mgnify:CR=1 FL=1
MVKLAQKLAQKVKDRSVRAISREERVFRKAFSFGVFDGIELRAYCPNCDKEIDVNETKSLHCPDCYHRVQPKKEW